MIGSVVGVILGPGGVFFLLVRKAINGSSEAIHRVETSVGTISEVQAEDHDTLIRAVTTLEAMKSDEVDYKRLVERHSLAIERIVQRCDLIHGSRPTVPPRAGTEL